MQPLLPPPILLVLGIVLFGAGEAARFKNYQKHSGGEVHSLCKLPHAFCSDLAGWTRMV